MWARRNLPPIRDQLELVHHETEIVPGIRVIPAPGHTPGHMAVEITSDSDRLLCISDAVIHPIHLEHPDWYPGDLVPKQALASRRRLLQRAVVEETLVHAFHFPSPGLGYVVEKGDAWQWQPAEITGLTIVEAI